MSSDGGRPYRETIAPGVYWQKDRKVRTDDGAEIRYTFLGAADGPVVALVAGFMCPDTWWYYLAPALAEHGYRVLLAHYRGVADSMPPTPLRDEGFTVERFARDMVHVLDAEGVHSVALVGHSMGVQVMLECYRTLRARTVCMVAVTGHFASPIRTLYDRRELSYMVYEPLRLALRLVPGPLRQAAWHAAMRLPALKFGQLIKAFGPRTDARIVDSYLQHLATRDLRLIMRVMAGMHAHSAADLLPEVDAPTLVIMGEKDPFSPPSQGTLMASAIPNAVARTIPLATHGAILEYPEQVNGYVLDFLAEHAGRQTSTSAGLKSIDE